MDAPGAGRAVGSYGGAPMMQQCRTKRAGDDDVSEELSAGRSGM